MAKVGDDVILNAGPFGGYRGTVVEVGEVHAGGKTLGTVFNLAINGFPEGVEFLCPPSEFRVVGGV